MLYRNIPSITECDSFLKSRNLAHGKAVRDQVNFILDSIRKEISENKNLYETLTAYGVGFHRHNSEIDQELKKVSKNVEFSFTPHLSPMFRGILSTIYVDSTKGSNIKKIVKSLKNFYKSENFIKIQKAETHISTNDVINTNYSYISVCKTKFKDKIIILSAIDNLKKGGAGQAVQNLNILFNFKKNKGLI